MILAQLVEMRPPLPTIPAAVRCAPIVPAYTAHHSFCAFLCALQDSTRPRALSCASWSACAVRAPSGGTGVAKRASREAAAACWTARARSTLTPPEAADRQSAALGGYSSSVNYHLVGLLDRHGRLW